MLRPAILSEALLAEHSGHTLNDMAEPNSGKDTGSDLSGGPTFLSILAIGLGVWALTALFSTKQETTHKSLNPVIKRDTRDNNSDERISPHGFIRPTRPSRIVWAPVEYFNPNTGTYSNYNCQVDLNEAGEVLRINWPTGGWLEADNLEDNFDGTQTITTLRGYTYTIDLTSISDVQFLDSYSYSKNNGKTGRSPNRLKPRELKSPDAQSFVYTYTDKYGRIVINNLPPNHAKNQGLTLKHVGIGDAKLGISSK